MGSLSDLAKEELFAAVVLSCTEKDLFMQKRSLLIEDAAFLLELA